jgi:hypothetical protein
MLENLELQTPLQTGELLLESWDPKCSYVVEPTEGSFTEIIVAGFLFLHRLSDSCLVHMRHPTFHFFILFTQALQISKVSVAFLSTQISKKCNTCSFS